MSYCDISEFVPIEDLTAEIQAFLPDVIPVVIEHLIRRQSILFADRTKAYTVTVYEDAQENVPGYPVTLPKCLASLGVKTVKYNGICYEPIMNEPCIDPCASYGFEAPTPSWIDLHPAPGKDGFRDIEIIAIAGLASDACEIPADFYTRWGQAITDGVLASLYGMKGEDWYSADLRDYYNAQSKEGASAARQDIFLSRNPSGGVPIAGDPWIL